jgi:hypothetical protein
MGEPVNVKRMTISVRLDLKARMDAVADPPNWSAVASAAFEAKLQELDIMKSASSLDELVEQYVAAEQIDEQEQYQEGLKAGREWAGDARLAGPRRLRRMQELENDPRYNIQGSILLWTNGMNSGIASGLYECLEPRGEHDRRDVEGFWEEVLGDGWSDMIEDRDFARGLCDGALEVWRKIVAHPKAKGKL